LPGVPAVVAASLFINRDRARRFEMLVLTRKEGQSIIAGDVLTVTVKRIAGNKVQLCFDAPKEVKIVRKELKRGKEDRNA
jgi:carbon storage regulator CsrA